MTTESTTSKQPEHIASTNEKAGTGEGNDFCPTRPIVAYHLFLCAAMVYLIIVVGGLTRLTESGLSITEWNPGFKGMRLPWTEEEWSEEWEKYKLTPEWAVLNQHMTVEDFKSIYMWEWSHRILGRLIGVIFLLPAMFFVARGYVAKGTRWKLFAIAGGIGFQGFLGWFMVKSGLSAPETPTPVIGQTHPNSTAPSRPENSRLDATISASDKSSTINADWHPRVSHFRLAAHLGTAFLVYLGMMHSGICIMRDYNAQMGIGKVSGWRMTLAGSASKLCSVLSSGKVARFRNATRGVTALVFITAMSGALVAGLDAGLVYSEFPYMGEGIAPPREELLDQRYALAGPENPSLSRLVIGNIAQNPVTVQFVHRCLATTTLLSVVGLWLYSRRLTSSLRQVGLVIPPRIPRLAVLAAFTAAMQATLGISTLIYLVPIELASAHQAGSVALLSIMTMLLASLRRNPGSLVLKLLNADRRQAVVNKILQRVQVR